MPPFPHRSTVPTPVIAIGTALTSAYVAGTIASTDEANMIGLLVTYTKGDETSIQIKVEATDDQGALTNASNWYQQVTQSASAGVVTLAPATYSLVASGLPATQKFTLLINPVKGSGFRISVQATGGTPTGVVGVSAMFGWV